MKCKQLFRSLALTCAALPAALSAHAQSANFNLSQSTIVPGTVLEPGSYSIRVLDHLQDRLLVQIQGSGKSSHALFIAVPAKSLTGSAGAITWTASAEKPALRGFIFSQGSPLEFVYPKAEAVSIAKANGSGVLAVDPASENKPAELANLNKEDMQVVTLWMLTPQRVDSSPGKVNITAAKYQGTPANPQTPQVASLERPSSPLKRLPHTASTLPLILLAAILAALSASLLHMLRSANRSSANSIPASQA